MKKEKIKNKTGILKDEKERDIREGDTGKGRRGMECKKVENARLERIGKGKKRIETSLRIDKRVRRERWRRKKERRKK